MTSSGKIISTIQTMAILITKPKRPKVSNLKGKVITFTMGLIKEFINPRTAPAKNRDLTPGGVSSSPPDMATPGIRRMAKYNPKIPTIICQRNCFIKLSYQAVNQKSI